MGTVRRSSWRQFLPYLALNVVVSAVTMLIVLAIWQGVSGGRVASSTPTPDVLARVASLLPTATATLPPSPTPVTYIVKDGDTLSSIARAHGITLDELMSANGLRDPNKIAVGQVLVIPIIGGTEGEPTATSQPGPQLPTATESSGGENQGIVIHGIEGIGNLESERVRILNEGGEINLAGWMMDDGEGNIYVFPSLRFRTVGMIVVHTKEGEDTVIDLYWGLDEPIWAPGKVITLRDDSGEAQSTFQIPDS
jgi:LysM repeat protein